MHNSCRAETTECSFYETEFCVRLLSANSRVSNKADLSEKTFSDVSFSERLALVHAASKETAV